MIIDLILDRRDGDTYNPKDLYDYAVRANADEIASAMDGGSNEDIQQALCDYVVSSQYDVEGGDIYNYILSVNWLDNDFGTILITAQNDNTSTLLYKVSISDENFDLGLYLRENMALFDWQLDDGEEGSGYVQYSCYTEEGSYLLANYYQEDFNY